MKGCYRVQCVGWNKRNPYKEMIAKIEKAMQPNTNHQPKKRRKKNVKHGRS